MIDIPMPRSSPIDEQYKELRAELDTARRAVIEANRKGSSVASDELLELRNRAYKAWQNLESYLREQKIIPDEVRA